MILVDHEGKIVLVNAQTEKLFGYPRAELLGTSIDNPHTRSMGAGRDLFGLRKDGAEVLTTP